MIKLREFNVPGAFGVKNSDVKVCLEKYAEIQNRDIIMYNSDHTIFRLHDIIAIVNKERVFQITT
jgi:hypothetical protein